MLSKTKKIVILCSMLALLVVTGVLNVVLNKQTSTDTNGKAQSYSDFFSGYRADRLATRNQSIEYLDAIISSAASTTDAVAQAQEKKLQLVDMMEQELVLEGLIKSLGYEDCIVTLSTENINCILKSKQLDDTQVAQVLGTLVTETKKDATSVKIIPVE